MKTGQEVLTRALQLLGYTDSIGGSSSLQDAELTKRGTTAVLQMYNDLQRIEHPTTFDAEPFSMGIDLKLSPVSVNDVMPYGVAMLIAQGDGNGDSQSMFAELYNQKRSSVPKSILRRTDVIPSGGW